ncbi:MAG: TIGR04076 family protein [Oscillospiraceae bacterium]|jgi:uncharacterized repeat protein (TIGR04076 family)|nr:TIGR04076 family protein [Oscillospiraceae bacterium]
MGRCRITILRKLYFDDLAREFQPFDLAECPSMSVGEVFYTAGPFGVDMPEGFCPPAWNAIMPFAQVLASGGKVYSRDETHITACPDGIRPVLFKMEGVK